MSDDDPVAAAKLTTTTATLYTSDPNKGWKGFLLRRSTSGDLSCDGKVLWFDDVNGERTFSVPLAKVIAESSGKQGLFVVSSKFLHLSIEGSEYWLDFGPSVLVSRTAQAISLKGPQAIEAWLKILPSKPA